MDMCTSTASSPPPPLALAPQWPAAVAQWPSVYTSSALRESLRRDICSEATRVWAAVLDERGTVLGMQRIALSPTGKILYREPALVPSPMFGAPL
jgi:hypothetical protein